MFHHFRPVPRAPFSRPLCEVKNRWNMFRGTKLASSARCWAQPAVAAEDGLGALGVPFVPAVSLRCPPFVQVLAEQERKEAEQEAQICWAPSFM